MEKSLLSYVFPYRVITRISQETTSTEKAPEAYYHTGFSHMYSIWKHWMTKEPDNLAMLYTNNKGEANGLVELIKKVWSINIKVSF